VSNETVAYLVTIMLSGGRKVMFRAETRNELWAKIQEHSWVSPHRDEFNTVRQHDTEKNQKLRVYLNRKEFLFGS
jgi:hypothetical protein